MSRDIILFFMEIKWALDMIILLFEVLNIFMFTIIDVIGDTYKEIRIFLTK